jgi:pyruvate ferredoxin oxidoreductase alpha subunit
MVFWAGLGRFPVTMAVVTRTLAPPWSIWNEHTDILAQRDAGWLIMMCESAQESYDTAIQAIRIAEDQRVLQPAMYGLDALALSHTAENVDLLDQDVVDDYLPSLDPQKLPVYIDPDRPITFGNLLGPDKMMEFRNLIKEAFERAKSVINEAAVDYSKISGRLQTGLFENYRCGDAEVVVLATGASSGDAKDAVDNLRDKGLRAGMIRLKTIRPFPGEEIKKVLRGAKVIATVDRDYSFGFGGILGMELSASLGRDVFRYIAGLGGRDITVGDFEGIINDALKRSEEKKEVGKEVWWGLKEGE